MASTSAQKKPAARRRTSGPDARKGGPSGSAPGPAKKRGRPAGSKNSKAATAGSAPPPVPEQGPQRRPRRDTAPAQRKTLGVVMGILALCAFFGAFGSSGSVLNWLEALLKGLFGYGCWLSVPVFAFCAAVLLLHPDKPARDRIAAALALMPALGVLGHILLCRQTFPPEGVATRLWTTGRDTLSGGVFSGTIARVSTGLLSRPVSIILFFALFLWLLTAALRWNVPAMVSLIRRRLLYGGDYEDWDEPEDDSWSHPRVQVIRSGEDTQRVPVQFDFPLDDDADSGAWYDAPADGDGGAQPDGVRPAAADEERRSSRRSPKKRGLFSAFQGEAVRLFSEREGQKRGKAPASEYDGYDRDDGYERDGGGARSRDAVLASTVYEPESERTAGRRNAAGAARNGGAKSGRGVSGASGAEAKPERGASAASGAVGADSAGPDSGELDPRKARAAASREVAAQAAAVSQEIAKKMDRPERKYRYPNLNNLHENKARNYVEAGAELRSNSRRLADTLNSFGVEATPGDVVHGPAVTRYEYTLEQGVKLSKITNLADDIALALGATGVRIAPIPTKSSVVGIEVPNRQVTPVLIRDVVAAQEFRNHPSTTAFALGKDIGGKNIVGCIEQLPHVLIAGTTGSGKSVCTNSLIISMLFHARPDQVRFIMVDPKMVELAPYNGIPHLLIPVVTDPKKAAGALQWATVEMMKRYRTFSEHGVKKLSEYNKAAEARELEPMPSIVVVIDELADLMMAAAKEVEESIVRIAQMGRAAGMHLVIATQRPSADVITGLMKANIPSRIAFAVASSMESRIILDTPGAEKLVGRGDMLYAPLGESRIRVQGCYIAPDEIERVVAFVKQTSEAAYDNDVIAKIEATVQEKKPPEQMTIPETPQEDDELLPAAVEVVLETGQASVSMLQRRLKLGYSRAARLVDQMEEKGYVGPFEGSKPRQLMLTQEKWQEMKMAAASPAQ